MYAKVYGGCAGLMFVMIEFNGYIRAYVSRDLFEMYGSGVEIDSRRVAPSPHRVWRYSYKGLLAVF